MQRKEARKNEQFFDNRNGYFRDSDATTVVQGLTMKKIYNSITNAKAKQKSAA